jgi:protein-disulfide isomerase
MIAADDGRRDEPVQSVPPTPASHGVGIATLAASLLVLAVTLATTFATMRDIRRLERRLTEGLGRVDAQLVEAATRSARVNTAPRGPDPARVYEVDIANAAVRGDERAPVTIVEFSDFQCPFCARVGPTLQELSRIYGSNVRLVWKHLPIPSLHEHAVGAAIASEAARNQGKFWEYHDKLFAAQNQLRPEDLKRYASELRLDMRRFEQDLRDPETIQRLQRDLAEADRLGLSGTPAFFINGRYVRGAAPIATFAKLIDEELQKLNLPVPARSTGN